MIWLIGVGSIVGKPGWAIALIAAVTIVLFFASVAGSASAAAIRGTVTDANGVNVTGATVILYQDGQEFACPGNPATTDANGYYEFTGLAAGAYSVQADKGGYYSSAITVSLSDIDQEANLYIPGYDSRAATPTVPAYVTPAPTPTPTPAPPTPTPTAKPSPTKVPLPSPEPAPGFGLLVVLVAMGIVAAFRKP